MPDLAAAIREHVLTVDDTTPHGALLAVVEKCEAMRAESAPGGVGHFFADEFEGVIARALGIQH